MAYLFFHSGMRNEIALLQAEYIHEPLLHVRYVLTILSGIGLFTLFRRSYFVLMTMWLYSMVTIQFLLAETISPSAILAGCMGPLVVTLVVRTKWSELRCAYRIPMRSPTNSDSNGVSRN